MKFLVDAQLPVRLSGFLQSSGYNTIHPRDLPQENASLDTEINKVSMQEERIVITKYADFVNSFLTIQQPYKLLFISTGNIKNDALETLVSANLQALIELFQEYWYIEMSRNSLIVHQ